MTLDALLFLGGVVVGYVVEVIRERWFWRRIAIRTGTFTSAPISTELPTVAELREPTWMERP